MKYEYGIAMQYLTPKEGQGPLVLTDEAAQQGITVQIQKVLKNMPMLHRASPEWGEPWEAVSHSVSFHVNTVVLSILLRRPA